MCENILGVGIHPVTMRASLGRIEEWISQRRSAYVCTIPAHTVVDALEDHALRWIINEAGLVSPGGMAIVWLLRLRGHAHVERVYGTDLLWAAS